jgi:hypothetical protein
VGFSPSPTMMATIWPAEDTHEQTLGRRTPPQTSYCPAAQLGKWTLEPGNKEWEKNTHLKHEMWLFAIRAASPCNRNRCPVDDLGKFVFVGVVQIGQD